MGFINSGAFWYDLSAVMSSFTVAVDGRTYSGARNGRVELDPFDPFTPAMTQRAVVGILRDEKLRTRFDVLTHTASVRVQELAVGRNAPVTVATLLIRMGKDEIVDAMVERYNAFIAEELAA